ncbi:hypothetical protein ACOSP7_026911 [Xanthoceras sorbifolium]
MMSLHMGCMVDLFKLFGDFEMYYILDERRVQCNMKVMVKFIKFHSTYGGEDNVFKFIGKYQSHGYVI